MPPEILKKKDIGLSIAVPTIPKQLPVYQIATKTISDRKATIDHFIKKFKLGKTRTYESDGSVYFANSKGLVQFYRPSGALWVRHDAAESKYRDERRPWPTVEVVDRDDDGQKILDLPSAEKKRLRSSASGLIVASRLNEPGAYFDGISLDQVSKLDEKGKEIARYPGEATVRFRYRLNGIAVEGPGAKTYAFFNPDGRSLQPVGIFHCWRGKLKARSVKLTPFDETFDRTLRTDSDLVAMSKRFGKIQINRMSLAYFAMSPHEQQEWLFPVLQVEGTVRPATGRVVREGTEFKRYFHVATPRAYVGAQVFAKYLIDRA